MSFELDRSSKKESTSIEEATSSTLSAIDNRPAQRRKYSMQQAARQSSAAKTSLQRQVSAASSALGNDTSKANKTGLPDGLKSGIEQLSGYDMSDVKVHANSSKPKEVGAHAYAQGTDIHLASGQEQHLPHEAWHAVQQKQGRVQPTTEVNGVAVNDNTSLESEADIMGSKALQMKATDSVVSAANFQKFPSDNGALQPKKIIQRVEDQEEKKFGGLIKQTMFMLEGESSWVGWIRNSTFTQLKGKIKEYAKASLGQRAILISDIYTLGQTWLQKHEGKGTTENEYKKEISIRNIVVAIRIKRANRRKKVEDVAKDQADRQDTSDSSYPISVNSGEEIQIGRSEDKVGLVAKAKSLLTGKESTFMKIDKLFSTYQGYHQILLFGDQKFDKKSIFLLKEVASMANEIKELIDQWNVKHHRIELPKSEGKADEPINKTIGDHLFYAATRPLTLLPERFGAIESFTNWWNKDYDAKFKLIDTIENQLGTIDLDMDLNEHVHFTAHQLAIPTLFEKSHTNATISVLLPNNLAKANGVGFKFTDEGVLFSENIALSKLSNTENYQDSVGLDIYKATLNKDNDGVLVESFVSVDKSTMKSIDQLDITGIAGTTFDFTSKTWSKPKEQFKFDALADEDLKFASQTASFTDSGFEASGVTLNTPILNQKVVFSNNLATVKLNTSGLIWGKATLSFSSPIKLLQLLPIPKDTITYEIGDADQNYERSTTINAPTISVNYQNLALTLEQLNAKVTKEAGSQWDFAEASTNLSLNYDKLFAFKGQKVALTKTDNAFILSATVLSIDFLENAPSFLSKDSIATIMGSSLKLENEKATYDFNSITITNITDLVNTPLLNISKIDEVSLKKSDAIYKVNVSNVKMKGAYQSLFSYDTSAEVELNLSSNMSLTSADFSIPELEITAEDSAPDFIKGASLKTTGLTVGYQNSTVTTDFKSVEINTIPESKELSVLGIKGVNKIILTKEEIGYKLAVINAKIDKKFGKLFNINGDTSIEVITDAEGKPTGSHSIFIQKGDLSFGEGVHSYLNGVHATVENLTMPDGFHSKKEEVSWGKLVLSTKPMATSLFKGVLIATAPNKVTVQDGSQDYKTTLEGTSASVVTPYFIATGDATFSLSAKTAPVIDKAALHFSASTPTLPPTIKPFWPIDISYPIPVGPFPFEANIGFFTNGGLSGELKDGLISYEDNTLKIGAKAGLGGQLTVGAKLGVAAGSSYLASVGVYGSASTTIEALMTGGINGVFKNENNTYTLQDLKSEYTTSGNATIDLKVGAEATVLYFFKKTIYETKVASWAIGSVERSGAYDFNAKSDAVDSTKSSTLLGGKKPLPKYPATNSESAVGKGLKSSSEGESGYAAVDSAKAAIRLLLDGENGSLANDEQISSSQEVLKNAIAALNTKANTFERGWFTRMFRLKKDSQKIADLSKELLGQLTIQTEKLKESILKGDIAEIQKINKNILFASELVSLKNPTETAIDKIIGDYGS